MKKTALYQLYVEDDGEHYWIIDHSISDALERFESLHPNVEVNSIVEVVDMDAVIQ